MDTIEVDRAKKRKTRNIILITAFLAIAAIIAGVFLTIFLIMPGMRYSEANDILESGKILDAYERFYEMDGYKDSEDKISSLEQDAIESADSLANQGKYDDAYALLSDFNSITGNFDTLDKYKAYYWASVGNWRNASDYGLTSIVIPDGTKEIGKAEFSNCKNLVSVSIPESVKKIGQYAFDGCTSLAEIFIPKSVTYVGFGAFNSIERLTLFSDVSSFSASSWNSGWNYGVKRINATWDCAGKVKLTFDSNGGTRVADMYVYSNELSPLPAPVKIGYKFSGWLDESGSIVKKHSGDAKRYVASWTEDASIGKTVNNAYDISENIKVTLDLSFGEDVYFVILSQSDYCNIRTEGEVNTYGRIYSSDKKLVASDDDSGEKENFSIDYYLNNGTYYIRLTSHGSGEVTFIIED